VELCKYVATILLFPNLSLPQKEDVEMCTCMGKYLSKIFFCYGKNTGSYDLEKVTASTPVPTKIVASSGSK